MRYRRGYDYLFLPDKEFEEDGKLIGALCIYVLFKVFDKAGTEIIFEDEKPCDGLISIDKNRFRYLCDLLHCRFDKEKLFVFEPSEDAKKSEYTITLDIRHYSKDIVDGCSLEPEMIAEEEFRKIFNDNIELFDSTVNYPAQTTTWFWEELK